MDQKAPVLETEAIGSVEPMTTEGGAIKVEEMESSYSGPNSKDQEEEQEESQASAKVASGRVASDQDKEDSEKPMEMQQE